MIPVPHRGPAGTVPARVLTASGGVCGTPCFPVMLTGTDASGQRVHAAKLLTLVGEDIYDLN